MVERFAKFSLNLNTSIIKIPNNIYIVIYYNSWLLTSYGNRFNVKKGVCIL